MSRRPSLNASAISNDPLGCIFEDTLTLSPSCPASLYISQGLCLIAGWRGIEYRGLVPIFAG